MNSVVSYSFGGKWQNELAKASSLSRQGKLPSFILLRGYEPEPLGHLAIKFAQIILCKAHDACGECGSCRQAILGMHSEVLLLDAFSEDSDTKGVYRLEAANAIQQHLQLHGFEGRSRVAVLYEAAALSLQAVNRLLKTLEELPENSFVIMTTTKPLQIPETLRGRSFTWVFRPEGGASMDANDLLGLEHRGELDQLLLGQITMAERLEIAARLGKSKNIDFPLLLDGIELLLSNDLDTRQPDANWDGAGRIRLRELLTQLRKLAVGGKISLNMQLALESIAIESSSRNTGVYSCS